MEPVLLLMHRRPTLIVVFAIGKGGQRAAQITDTIGAWLLQGLRSGRAVKRFLARCSLKSLSTATRRCIVRRKL